MSGSSPGLRPKVFGALLLVLAVAVVARVSWELLAPLFPWLVTLACLVVIYALIAGRFHR